MEHCSAPQHIFLTVSGVLISQQTVVWCQCIWWISRVREWSAGWFQ